MEPPLIPLIKETCHVNPEKDLVKLKLRIYPTSSTSDLYEFNMSLFDHGDLEEFLLFIRKFNITLAATRNLEMEANIQYLCTLLHGKALRQFDLLSTYV